MHHSQTIESTDHEEASYSTPVGLAHRLDEEKKRTADVLFSVPQKDGNSETTKTLSITRFADLQLSSPLLRGLSEAGFSRPSPVQIKAIPLGRMGLDMIVQAKSGTGKTVVFVVVLLEAIDAQRPVLQALVLSPTREIALQSQTVFQRLGAHIPGLKCQLFVGGLPLADDLCRLQQCHIAVGTPGRVRYLIETGYMSVDQVRHLVLDEADLLLAGGAEAKLTGGSTNNAFPADVNYIWWSLPQNKQMLALSATYTDYLVEEHLQRYMNNPALVRLVSHDPALLGVRQFFLLITSPDRSPASVFAAKVNTLCKLLSSVEFQQCLIFSNFHSSAQDLCDALHSRGWPVSYISSTLDQEQRFRAFNRLRAFHCRVLVSTDLTSRGIDAENVNLVVSLEVPWEHEIYVHRVGRAGRFGSYGASVLIVADLAEEKHLLKRLQSKCPTNINQLPGKLLFDSN
ncbi:DEAD box ATP dependent RNA helicase [Paragonimus heterotremus]|uniref:RNA helicase n=1 Tax=Paragonimus heterotremus TaxID=100268 RepID=A0A8J4WIG7_9TREM|nr:DEAD box ATP dependent RNA helicase [Paragonimus heterotremus]